MAVLTVFSPTFNALASFLIDVVGSFLITVTREVKKHCFRFLFNRSFLFLKKLFFLSIGFFALCSADKETPIISEFFRLGFCVRQIIDSLSFLFLLSHI